jgi:hypothetical protein
VDSNGRTIWIADVHRGDANVSLCAQVRTLLHFLELEAAIRGTVLTIWRALLKAHRYGHYGSWKGNPVVTIPMWRQREIAFYD